MEIMTELLFLAELLLLWSSHLDLIAVITLVFGERVNVHLINTNID